MIKQQIQERIRQQQELRHSVNKESYYYTETISIKHYAWAPWNANRWTHDIVTRFREGDYNRDMAAVNARINDLEIEINSLRQQETGNC